jgi:GxxExxY protein
VTKAGESTKGHDFADCTGAIIKAAMEVHKQLGSGFMEAVYQRALELEMEAVGLSFSREVDVPVYYKGQRITTRRADFVVEDCIVELKARSEMLPADPVQTLNYLKAARFRLALLINFGANKVEVKRFVNDRGRHAPLEEQGP